VRASGFTAALIRRSGDELTGLDPFRPLLAVRVGVLVLPIHATMTDWPIRNSLSAFPTKKPDARLGLLAVTPTEPDLRPKGELRRAWGTVTRATGTDRPKAASSP
jgi:hypothetical protein